MLYIEKTEFVGSEYLYRAFFIKNYPTKMKKEKINDLFILNYFYVTSNSTKINGHKTKNIPNDIQEYLNNRFKDSESNKETIMRIKYGPIEERPKCPICGNPVRWYGHSAKRLFFNTCCHIHENILRKKHIKESVKEKYGVDNVFQLESVKNLIKETFIENYGVDNPLKSSIIKAKLLKTCLERYNVKNGGGSIQAQEKIKSSIVKHYGSMQKYYEYCTKKSKLTRLKRYNDANYNNMPKNRETCLKHFGVTSFFASEERKRRNDEILKKITKTKRKNHTWTSSKAESIIYNNILRLYFNKNDIICLYKSKEYPFNCDFYIKSLNLYIEYLGAWTHGNHPYDKNNIEDLKLLEYWKSKTNKNSFNYYNSAILTWTISDPLKRKIAKDNKLNYIEFWSIIKVEEYFSKYEKN